MNQEKADIGLKRIQETVGPDAIEIIKEFKGISEDFARYVLEFAYGDVYARKGISDKTRETAAVSTLIGQGNTGLPLKAHMKAMLNVGHTKNDIIELLLFLIPYVGFPRIVEALFTAKALFEEV